MVELKKRQIIKGLKNNLSFKKAAKIIIKNKLLTLIKLINKFNENESVENLHDLRIAVIRLRYSFELFYDCFPKKVYFDFYNMLENIQDKLGDARDLDVMSDKLNYFEKNYGILIPDNLHSEMEKKRNEHRTMINKILSEFLSSKLIQKLLTIKRGDK
jgi:CHAD domain-containing protein